MQSTSFYTSSIVPQVSHREQEVLELLSRGHSSVEIASTLFLSPYTIDDHRKSLLAKLNAKNVAQMIRRGFELRLLTISI